MSDAKQDKRFEILVRNAGGPVQLLVTDLKEGSGLRVLGAKGSPYASTLHVWKLSEEQMDKLIKDLKSVRGKKRKVKP